MSSDANGNGNIAATPGGAKKVPSTASMTAFQSIKRRDSGNSISMQSIPTSSTAAAAVAAQKMHRSTSTLNKSSLAPFVVVPTHSNGNINHADDNNTMKNLEATRKLQNLEEQFADRKRSGTFTSIYSGSAINDQTFGDSNLSLDNISFEEDDDLETPTWKLGELLQSIGEKDHDKEFLVAKCNQVVSLLIAHPNLKNDVALTAFGARVLLLLTHTVSEVRACGYRLARYILQNEDSLRMLVQLRVELFLIITFARDNKALLEKEQALKLIRQLIELPDGVHTLTIGLVRAIVALAESPDDKLQNACIETLCEISLFAPQLAYKCDGLKIIIQSFVEGPYDMASPCLITVLKLLEAPQTRSYIIDQVNISYLVSSFCEVHQAGHKSIERLQNSAFMLTIFFKTWPGLIALSQDSYSAIHDLVNCLAFEIPNLRDILMDIFFDVLMIRTLPWIKSGNVFGYANQHQKSFAQEANNQQAPQAQQQQQQQKSTTMITSNVPEKNHTVVNHYSALLLMILLKCNLTNKLVSIISEASDDLNKRKAVYLLAEIMSLGSQLIPHDLIATSMNLDTFLPILTESKFISSKIPSASVFQMARLTERLKKERKSLNQEAPLFASLATSVSASTMTTATASALTSTEKKNQRSVPFHIKYNTDDIEFRKLLNDTKILSTKEFAMWDWDLISDLMQGPLLNGRRLEETIKTTKIMKRLMSFYRPFKFRFSKISKKNKNAAKYVRIGCEMFETLLHTDEGAKFLSENKLLAQIAECIAQVDPFSGITSTESLYSKHKLETTMAGGYFKMLGVLSKDPNGLKMLEQWNIFSMFYHITDADRDDLIKLIIQMMDYTIPSHLRIILAKVLTSAKNSIRVFATEHLYTLLSPQSTYHDEDQFVLKLLLDQLYDSNARVVRSAVKILDAYIEQEENLNKVVDLKPDLYHLAKIGNSTLLSFLSTTKGFKYLDEFKIIDKELKEWIDYKIFKYVYDIENLLIHELIQPESHNNLIFKQSDAAASTRPQHFFGELVKIDEGVRLISESGIIEKCSKKTKSFLEFKNNTNELPEDEAVQLKGYLWCIGHICSTKEGVRLFDNRNLIEDIVYLTETCSNISMKGTGFLVLGLMAKTPEGMEILDENKWCCKVNINRQLIGVCLPYTLEDFMSLQKESDKNLVKKDKFENYVNITTLINNELSNLNPNDYSLMQKLTENFMNILSHLLTSKAISNLKNIRYKNGSFFQSEKNGLILFKVLTKLMSNFKFSKNIRKFLLVDLIDFSHYLKILCKKDRQKLIK